MKEWRYPDTWVGFVVVLGVAIIIDNAPFPRMLWDAAIGSRALDDSAQALLRSGWVAVAAWTLIRPRSMVRYAVLCGAGVIVILLQLPRVPNHWVLELAVYAGSLVVLAIARDPRARFHGLRLLFLGSIVSVYLWTFVHKLNFGFFDPDVSCAAVFLDSLSERLLLPSPPAWLRSSAVGGVLLVEGLMPVLLLSSRTRGIAIVLGLGLHLMFGLFVAAFSILMWATYFLLLPPSSLEPAFQRFERGRALSRVPSSAVRALAFIAVIAATLLIKDVPRLRGLTQQETLLLPLFVVIALFLISGLATCGMRLPMEGPPRTMVAAALAVSLILFANGTMPYLGVRNTLAFSMFSNLRTEGGVNNHLFLPNVETPWSILGDQVRILESSDAELRAYVRPQHRVRWNWTSIIDQEVRADLELPFFMIRFRAQELRDDGEEIIFQVGVTVEPSAARIAPDTYVERYHA